MGGGGELVQLVRNIHKGMSNSHRGMERVGDEFARINTMRSPWENASNVHTGRVTLPGGWGERGGGDFAQLVSNIHTGRSNSHRGMEREGDEFA